MRSRAATAAMDIFAARIHGQGRPAALPHLLIDPIVVGAQWVQAWQTIVSRAVKPIEAAVLTVTPFHAGAAWNMIPENVLPRGTVRCFSPQVRAVIEQSMQQIANSLGVAHGCRLEWWYDQRFAPTVNAAAATAIARRSGHGRKTMTLMTSAPAPSAKLRNDAASDRHGH